MITEDELRGYYAGVEVTPESEGRLVSAVLDAPAPGPRRRNVLVGAALGSAAVVAGAVVLVAIRGTSSSDGSVSGDPSVAAIVPPPKAGTFDGAVLDNGRPVSGATVSVTWGDAAAMRAVPPAARSSSSAPAVLHAVTDAHGSFTVGLPRAPFVFRVRVATRDGRLAQWPRSTALVHKDSAAEQLVFDLGRHAVTVNGRTSRLGAPPTTVVVAGTLELVGGPAGTEPRGVPGAVYAYQSRDQVGTTWSAKANSRGEFTMTLPPGTYYFRGSSPLFHVSSGSSQPCRSGAIDATADFSVHPQVECQVR